METRDQPSDVELALAAEFRAAVDDARGRVSVILEPACPTAEFLQALAREVLGAANDPGSVPYPELADPDQYWAASVKPQTQSIRDSVATVVEWLEARVIGTMEVAETDMKQIVDAAGKDPGPNPAATRSELIDQLGQRCTALHHQMAELLHVLPDPEPLEQARAAHDDGLRVAAARDVDQLRASYLRDAGGDEAHQRFAEQQWAETYGERVAHRQAMLAGAVPWRHQELALVGYERARADADAVVEQTVARLQAPLGSMASLLIERYDAAL